MKLHFKDYAAEPQPEQQFEDALALGNSLEKQRKISMMCQLISEGGRQLQIGIDGDISCVQFLSNGDMPPYYMAVTPTQVVEGIHDFDMTGSLTEVSAEHCLPFAF